ncbi:MAG: hypothetical protein HC938_17935 [Nitrospira sp.]|nr:hypothetical protein [Nitrospira sp.]
MPDLNEPHLHQLTVSDLFTHLGTRESGLSPEEAQQRLSEYGPNVLKEPGHYSLIRGSSTSSPTSWPSCFGSPPPSRSQQNS